MLLRLASAALLCTLFSAPLSSPRAESPFLRGDANADGALDISDPFAVLRYLFLGSFEPTCLAAADAGNDGKVELTDAVELLTFLFGGGGAPAAPYPWCGRSAGGGLGCDAYPAEACRQAAKSPLLWFLDALYFSGTEPCCLPGLGVWPVRAGRCRGLGGVPPGDAGCDLSVAEPNGLFWARGPGEFPVDKIFSVEVLGAEGTGAQYLTFDIYEIGADGERVGPLRVAYLPVGPAAAALAEGTGVHEATIDLSGLEKGRYSLRVTGWRPSEGGGGEPVRGGLGLEALFEICHGWSSISSQTELAGLSAQAPHGDALMDALAGNALASQEALRAFESALSTPAIEDLKDRIREIEDEAAAAEKEEAEARRRAQDAESRAQAVERCLKALIAVNRHLDSWYGPEAVAALEDLIRRREEILAGAAEEDKASLADALSAKEARAAAIDAALPAQRADCEQMKKDLEDLEKAIRDQFRVTRHAAGNHKGSIKIEGGKVTYEVVGIYHKNGSTIEYAPDGKRFKEEKKKLDELIAEYEDLARRLEECRRAVADLESERAALADNIAFLKNAGSELEELDRIIDTYFGEPDFSRVGPYLRDLIAWLRACGEGWLADLLEDLFRPIPRTLKELEEFLKKLAALRDAKHAREAEMAEEIRREEEAAAEEERRADEAKKRKEELEDELRRKAEELRRATEEAEKEAREAKEKAEAELKAEAERRKKEGALRERLRELRRAAQEGGEDALLELIESTGLGLLDEAFPDLKLGSGIGKILSGADFPACFCEFLEAFMLLFAAQDELLEVYAEGVVQKFLECTGLDQYLRLASVSGMAGTLADGVKRMSRAQRLKAAAALKRVLELLDC